MVCHNPDAATRDAAIRAQMLTRLEGLIAGSDGLSERKRAELAGVISTKPGLNRYLRTTPGGLLRIDQKAVATEAKLDGRYLPRHRRNTRQPTQTCPSTSNPLDFTWVAASARGTIVKIVKIDTITGDVLGQYWSAPDGRGRNPSRTTVDGDGNVWTANRDEGSGGAGSVVKIGLEEKRSMR